MNVKIHFWNVFKPAAMISLLSISFGAGAANYPTGPITLVVPYSAGSATDVVARIFANGFQPELGVPIIVENRPGANGTIGTTYASKASPDGYTLIVAGATTHSAAPSLFKNLQYDPVEDFQMIYNAVNAQFLLVVSADARPKTFKDFVADLQEKQGKASFGYGSATTQVASSALMKRENLQATAIAYRSNPQAVVDLIGGVIDFMFLDQTTALSQIRAGKVRALAVASKERMTELPEVPTLNEVGVPDFLISGWTGILAPKGVAPDIATKLAETAAKVAVQEEVRERLSLTGRPLSPQPLLSYDAYMREQRDDWAQKVKDAGIPPVGN